MTLVKHETIREVHTRVDKLVKNMLNQDITHLAPVANAVETPGMFDVSTSTARRKLEIGELFDKCQGRYSAASQTNLKQLNLFR